MPTTTQKKKGAPLQSGGMAAGVGWGGVPRVRGCRRTTICRTPVRENSNKICDLSSGFVRCHPHRREPPRVRKKKQKPKYLSPRGVGLAKILTRYHPGWFSQNTYSPGVVETKYLSPGFFSQNTYHPGIISQSTYHPGFFVGQIRQIT